MRALWFAFLLLLVVPSALANHTPVAPPAQEVSWATAAVAIHEDTIAVETVTWANTVVAVTTFTVRPQSSFVVLERTHFMEIVSQLYWTDTALGVGRVTAEVDGVTTDCSGLVRTIDGRFIGVVGAQQAQQGGISHAMMCEVQDLAEGIHNLTLRFTTHSGTPNTVAVLDSSVRVVQVDTEAIAVQSDFEILTGLTATEFGTMVGLGFALLAVAAFSKSKALNIFAGLLAVLLGVLLLFFTSSAVVVLVAVFLGLAGAVQLLITFLESLPGKKPGRFFE